MPFLKHSAAIFLLVPLFFGPIKVNFRPISNYRDTPNTFSVLTIFETPCFAIFPNFAVFCKKKNKKKHIWLFFPNKKLTITDVSSHFQGFLTFRLIFSIKEVNIWAIFPDLSPKLFFFFFFCVFAFNIAYLVVPAHFRPRSILQKQENKKNRDNGK